MKTKPIKYAILFTLFMLISFTSCQKSEDDFDAAGTFEATEITVSSEVMGKILTFEIQEGDLVDENQQVGIIDSVQLYLKKLQLEANQKSLQSRRPDVQKQIAALEQQISTAKFERKRVENLVNANAMNTKQLDDVNAQIKLLESQLSASKSTLKTTIDGIKGDDNALDIQVKQIEDQLVKCRITSPIKGVVLVKYSEKGELTNPGKALFKVADISNMTLRAYITSDQLTQIKLGQKVKVMADFGENQKEYNGVVSWISSKSEFTPKTIETKDERANLVYATKINVQNDGYLKIGMYGNVKF